MPRGVYDRTNAKPRTLRGHGWAEKGHNTAGLNCPKCGAGPFKNKHGLNTHDSIKHTHKAANPRPEAPTGVSDIPFDVKDIHALTLQLSRVRSQRLGLETEQQRIQSELASTRELEQQVQEQLGEAVQKFIVEPEPPRGGEQHQERRTH